MVESRLIMQRVFPNWLGLLVVLAIALYLCWLLIAPFVLVLMWAGVLAIVAYPLQKRWRQRGLGPNTAALLTTTVVVLVVLVPTSLLALAIVRQAVGAADAVHRTALQMLDPESRIYQLADQYLDLEQFLDRQFLAERIREFTGTVAARTIGLVGGILGVIINMVLVLFTLFFLLRDGDRIVPIVRDWLPLEPEEADAVIRRTHEVISASIYGVLVIAALQGALGGLAFWVLGLPSPLLWGTAMFLLAMVPLVGSSLIWGPAAIYLLYTGSWIRGIILIVWGALIIGTIDNILRPILVGGRTKLHELVVFFSVLGGLQVFGILGLVVGPVVVAITLSLFDVIRRVNQRQLAASAPPLQPAPATPPPAAPPAEPISGSPSAAN